MPEAWQWLLLGLVVVVALHFLQLQGLYRRLALLELRLGTTIYPPATESRLEPGTPAPEVDCVDLDSGQPIAWSSFYADTAMLTFLSATCTACHKLAPHLQAFAAEHRDIDHLVVFDGDDSAAREFRRATGLSLRFAADPSGAVARAFEVHLRPTTVVLDAAHEIASVPIQPGRWEDLEAALEGLGHPTKRATWRAAESAPGDVEPLGDEGGVRTGDTRATSARGEVPSV